MQYIRLLCQSGAGLQAIASPFSEAVRELIGAASGSIFWLSDANEPVGFYHDSATAEIKELFVSNFDAHFFATEKVNIAHFVTADGPSVGKMLDLALQRDFASGNIHRLLCRPLGHDLFLDMSAQVEGAGKAVFCGWYPPGHLPSLADALALEPLQPLMQAALAAGDAGANWRTSTASSPHLVASADGGELLAIDEEAERILMSSHLLRQNLSLISQPTKTPDFVALLARLLAAGEDPVLRLPVPDGRLVCRASRAKVLNPGEGPSWRMFVSLKLEVAEEVAKVSYLMNLNLTPLQRDIAAHALLGGDRRDCMERLQVSDESLKKHLRPVFAATGTTQWRELQQLTPV